MKKSYLKITHGLLSKKLFIAPIFIFSIYYHQYIDLIECKIFKPFSPEPKKKPPQNLCNIFFENKALDFINIGRILRDTDIVKPLLSSSVKFPMPLITYTMTPAISTKFLNFNKFVNNLDLDLCLTNRDSPPCKCSYFADRRHKHTVTGHLRIIRHSVLRKLFLKDLNREVRSKNLEGTKCCKLEDLDNCISSWCCKNDVGKSFFLK